VSLGPVHLLLLAVAAQRLAELAWSHRNERRLRARGAVEHGAGHYPLIVAVHAGLLGALFWAAPADRSIALPWLVLLLALQPLRLWILATLGERWTTRVLVPQAAPLVATGPYRWLRHPNYLLVAVEVPTIALAAGEPAAALGFGLANLAVLALRIRVEERALGRGREPRRAPA
jgi:methyltransferase